MAKVYEIHLPGNCTEINGTIIRIPAVTAPATNAKTEDDYDHKGAMQFIVATVLVYSICGVLCTLVNRMKRLREKSHRAYLQDEYVQRYLKSEKLLKYDGRREKMMYDCGKVVETVTRFEEKQKLREIERDIASGDFSRAVFENEDRKKKKRKKKSRPRSARGTLGHIGLSLFYIPESNVANSNIEDVAQLTSADEATNLISNNNDTEILEILSKGECSGSMSDIHTKGEHLGMMSDMQAKGKDSGDTIYEHAKGDVLANYATDLSYSTYTPEKRNSKIQSANVESLKLPETALDIDELELAYADD